MKRINIFEFEDIKFLSSDFRACLTNLIIVFHKLMGSKQVLVNVITELKQKQSFSTIVDIGSGSGGIMPEVINAYNSQNKGDKISLILSDLYPNKGIVEQVNGGGEKNISYLKTSLNACELSKAPKGLKTLICSFHHLSPEIAGAILRSAQENKEPILIYEMINRNIPKILFPVYFLATVVLTLCLTPFVRPLRMKQIAYTYCLPLIPFCFSWDALASIVRLYSFKDIHELIGESDKETYEWTMKDVLNAKGRKCGHYILGQPKL